LTKELFHLDVEELTPEDYDAIAKKIEANLAQHRKVRAPKVEEPSGES
jgi:L-asparaginase/Glu-tRNA(Gln) amidotransferase subunit D